MRVVTVNRIPDRSTLAQKQRFFRTLLNALRPPSFEKGPTHGTFAACQTVKPSEGFSLNCFHVEGAGDLQLPLSIDDCSKLRSACQQAPFGNGLSTVVDSNVRTGWQVDASKVTFPGATTFLSDTIQALAIKAVSALELDGSGVHFEAQFYKLLFCEAGGRFNFRGSSKKLAKKGRFGSLVLQLPTEEGYTGGKFVVKHKDKTKEFDCHMVSAIGFCYTVSFADCLQELQNIESGTRLCLAFNLVKRPPLDRSHEGSMPDRLKRVELVLDPWLKDETAKGRNVCQNIPGGKLAIPLQHKYGEEITFARLKGDDVKLTELLKECRDENKNLLLDLHLCTVTKRVAQHVSDYGDNCEEEDEVALEFNNWIGLDDKAVALDGLRLDMWEEVVLLGDDLFDSEPDYCSDEMDEWYRAKYHSDEPRIVNCVYHKPLLVVWPRAYSVAIAWGGSVFRALDILQKTLEISDPNFREQLHHIVLYCQRNASKVWEDDGSSNTNSVTAQLLSLCTRVSILEDVLQILRLLGTALYQHDTRENNKDGDRENDEDGDREDDHGENDEGRKVGVRNAEVAEAVANAAQTFGWEVVSSPIINLARQCSSSQGESFVHLARRLICIDNMDAGVLVAKAASEALKAHIAELESHQMPEFSWRQPRAKFRENRDVEKFLRGPQEIYEYRGFCNRAEARSFCQAYFRDSGGKALARYFATAEGNGHNARCLIRKTRHQFYFSLDRWREEQKLIERLKLEVAKLRSTVPGTNSIDLSEQPIGSGQPDSKRQRLDSAETDGEDKE